MLTYMYFRANGTMTQHRKCAILDDAGQVPAHAAEGAKRGREGKLVQTQDEEDFDDGNLRTVRDER